MNKENKLPKYWIVENDYSQEFRDIVLKYLNYTYGSKWRIGGLNYYGFDGESVGQESIQKFNNNPTLLTLAEFKNLIDCNSIIDFKIKGTKLPTIPAGTYYKLTGWGDPYIDYQFYTYMPLKDFISYGVRNVGPIVYILAEKSDYCDTNYYMFKESDIIQLTKEQGMIEEGVILPERWYIQTTQEDNSIICDWFDKTFDVITDRSIGNYYTSTGKGRMYYATNLLKELKDYTKITFEQFQKYVLKQDIMEKEVIGYKLLKDMPGAKAGCIGNINSDNSVTFRFDDKNLNPIYYDLSFVKKDSDWFAPIYKDLTPIIIINGYEGKFYENYVEFGCAKISKLLFTELYRSGAFHESHTFGNKEITSVTIGNGTFNRDQIKEIAEYYLERSK